MTLLLSFRTEDLISKINTYVYIYQFVGISAFVLLMGFGIGVTSVWRWDSCLFLT
jgi:hypothetical protein